MRFYGHRKPGQHDPALRVVQVCWELVREFEFTAAMKTAAAKVTVNTVSKPSAVAGDRQRLGGRCGAVLEPLPSSERVPWRASVESTSVCFPVLVHTVGRWILNCSRWHYSGSRLGPS